MLLLLSPFFYRPSVNSRCIRQRVIWKVHESSNQWTLSKEWKNAQLDIQSFQTRAKVPLSFISNKDDTFLIVILNFPYFFKLTNKESKKIKKKKKDNVEHMKSDCEKWDIGNLLIKLVRSLSKIKQNKRWNKMEWNVRPSPSPENQS